MISDFASLIVLLKQYNLSMCGLFTNKGEYFFFVKKCTSNRFCFNILTTGEVRTISPIELNLTTRSFDGFDTNVKLKKLSNIA